MGLKDFFKKLIGSGTNPTPNKDPYNIGKTCCECGETASIYTTVWVRGVPVGKWFCRKDVPD
jgi:hypothetical protein